MDLVLNESSGVGNDRHLEITESVYKAHAFKTGASSLFRRSAAIAYNRLYNLTLPHILTTYFFPSQWLGDRVMAVVDL